MLYNVYVCWYGMLVAVWPFAFFTLNIKPYFSRRHSAYCDRILPQHNVCPSVCLSVILMHRAKAAGWNEMLFGRDTRVIRSNIVLDTGPGLPTGRGDLGVRTTRFQRCCLSPYYFGCCFHYQLFV